MSPVARELFLQLLDLPRDQRREALVTRGKGIDPVIVAQVARLLDADDIAQQANFMTSPTASMSKTGAVITEGPGSKVGSYKILQLIGEGGFGSVFLAEQHEPVRRRVALKIIKLGMDTRQVIARFEAERQALALMDHPHIARVLDGGATETGRPYFVMEYVIGDSITKFADAHVLTVKERLDLFQQVCSAVQHAHTKGIIHRDLKPGNILVSMVDGKPFAKVIDFGIAKATAGGALTDKTLFTQHKQLIGTPEYMSPEQAEGSLDIDTRTDVYSLGVLLYELLTGTTPIEGKKLRSAAFDEMRRMIREDEPLAPSMKLSRSLETLASTAAARKAEPGKLSSLLKGELDWIVLRALEKERGRRYETASALAEDVRRHLAGEAVVAAPVSRVYRLSKFVRKNKGPVAAGAAIAAALLVGIAGTTWQWHRASGLVEAAKGYLGGIVAHYADREQGSGGGVRVVQDDKGEIIGYIRVDDRDSNGHALPQPRVAVLAATSMLNGRDGTEASGLEVIRLLGQQASNNAAELAAKNTKLQLQSDAATTALSEIISETMPTAPGGMSSVSTVLPDGRRYTWVQTKGEDGKPTLRIVEGHGVEAFDAKGQLVPSKSPPPDVAMLLLTNEIRSTVAKLKQSTDAAEWSAYTANLALAQAAIDARAYPEARRRLSEAPINKRGWEWHSLQRQASSVIFNRPGPTMMAQFTPRQRAILTNGYTNTPVLISHDAPNAGQIIAELIGHTSLVFGASFTSDGAWLSTWGVGNSAEAGSVRLWRGPFLGAVKPSQVMAIPGLTSYSGSVDPDAKRIAVGYEDGRVRVFNAESGQPVITIPSGERATSASFANDGQFVVSTKDGSVCIWHSDSEHAAPAYTINGADSFDICETQNSSGSSVLTWGSTEPCTLWKLHSDGRVTKIAALEGLDERVRTAVFSPDGRLIATSKHIPPFEPGLGLIRLWDSEDDLPPHCIAVLRGHPGGTVALAFNHTGTLLASGGSDGTLTIWNVDKESAGFGRKLWTADLGSYVSKVGFDRPTERGDDVVFGISEASDGSAGSGLTVLRVRDGGSARSTLAGGSDIQSRLDVLLGQDVMRAPVIDAYTATPTPQRSELMTPDGSRLVKARPPRSLHISDVASGRMLASISTRRNIIDFAVTPDGTRLVILQHEPGQGLIMEVLDSRPPETRLKDLEAEWAERVPAGQYLDTLWASDTPNEKLRDAVINDSSLTLLRRLVTVEMLDERLEDDRLAAEEAYAKIIKDQTDKQAVLDAAAKLELPKRVKARVVAKAAGWEFKTPEASDTERLAEETKLRQLAEARLVITKFAEEDAGGGDEHVLKALDLGKARLSLEATLGRLHPEVLDAIELEAVRARDRLGELRVAIALFTEAIDRRSISRTAVDAVDLRLWSARAYTHWLSSDLSACAGEMRTVGGHLAAVWRTDPGADFSLMTSVGVFRVGRFADADEVGQLARKLSATTAQSLLQEAVAQPPDMLIWRLDSLTRSNLALSALDRKTSSMNWVPVHSVVRHRLSTADDATLAAAAEIDGKPGSLTGGKVLDREGHRAAAREALAKARALMAPAADGTPSPWANDEDAKALIAEAAALIEK